MYRRLIFLCFLLFPLIAYTQTSLGIRGGVSTSTYNYLPTPGSRNVEVPGLGGTTFALVFEYFSSKNAGIELNLQYIRMGFEQSNGDETNPLVNQTKLNYLKLPVLSSFFIGKSGRFQVKAGPHLGYLLNAEDIQREISDSTTPVLPTFGGPEDKPKKLMYGITAGAGISKLFGKSTLAGEVRFSYDFTNPESQDRVFDIYSTSLEFTLAYLFQIKERK